MENAENIEESEDEQVAAEAAAQVDQDFVNLYYDTRILYSEYRRTYELRWSRDKQEKWQDSHKQALDELSSKIPAIEKKCKDNLVSSYSNMFSAIKKRIRAMRFLSNEENDLEFEREYFPSSQQQYYLIYPKTSYDQLKRAYFDIACQPDDDDLDLEGLKAKRSVLEQSVQTISQIREEYLHSESEELKQSVKDKTKLTRQLERLPERDIPRQTQSAIDNIRKGITILDQKMENLKSQEAEARRWAQQALEAQQKKLEAKQSLQSAFISKVIDKALKDTLNNHLDHLTSRLQTNTVVASQICHAIGEQLKDGPYEKIFNANREGLQSVIVEGLRRKQTESGIFDAAHREDLEKDSVEELKKKQTESGIGNFLMDILNALFNKQKIAWNTRVNKLDGLFNKKEIDENSLSIILTYCLGKVNGANQSQGRNA